MKDELNDGLPTSRRYWDDEPTHDQLMQMFESGKRKQKQKDMENKQRIAELQKELGHLQLEEQASRVRSALMFRAKINQLILTTPSGDIRNELTELNILFETLMN